MFATRVLTTVAELMPISPEWDRLAALDVRDGFCRTAGWYLSWLRHLKPEVTPFVIEVRKAGDLIGLAPFCRIQQNRYVKAVCLGGSHIACGDYLDILNLAEHSDHVYKQVFSFLAEIRGEWDLLSLPDVAEGSALLRYAAGFAETQGWKLREHQRQTCPVIELPSSYEEYLSTVSAKMRKGLRQKRKFLIDRMGCEVVVHSSGPALEHAIDKLIQLHLARWNSVGDPGTLGQPGFGEFLKELSKTGVCDGTFRLYELRHQGKPVAALLNFHCGESALQFQSGWNPASPLANHSPCWALMAVAIENAIREGKRYYDLMRGDEAYKHSLTKIIRHTATYLIARSVGARAYLTNLELRDQAKRSLRALRRAA